MFKSISTNFALKCYSGRCILVINRYLVDAVCPKLTNVDIIQNVLGFSEEDVTKGLSNKYAEIEKLTANELLQRLDVLQATGVADIKDSNCLLLAKNHQLTLKNRILFMQECGFRKDKITSTNIKRFLTLMRVRIGTLKKMNIIDCNSDVNYSLLEHAELLDHYKPTDDENNILTLKLQLLKILLKNELDMNNEILHQRPSILKRLKNKSIRLIKRNIEIARNIGISSHRICRNPYLLWADPDNTVKALEEIKELAGVDMKLCYQLYPKIVSSSCENLKQILECLKEFGFHEESIQKCLVIFTLSAKNVRKRLVELEKDEFFKVSKRLPRSLMMVCCYNKVQQRMNLLREVNIANPSVNTISSSDQKFDRYYKFGSRRQVGNDIINYVSVILECDRLELRQKLEGFHCWRYIPLVEIAKNINLLRDYGFNNEEIFSNIQVLFYHASKILEELKSLDTRDGLECCKDESGQVQRAFILPLVVYFIEKTHNFSSHSFCFADEDLTYSDIAIPKYT